MTVGSSVTIASSPLVSAIGLNECAVPKARTCSAPATICCSSSTEPGRWTRGARKTTLPLQYVRPVLMQPILSGPGTAWLQGRTSDGAVQLRRTGVRCDGLLDVRTDRLERRWNRHQGDDSAENEQARTDENRAVIRGGQRRRISQA